MKQQKDDLLNQEKLKELVHYDPETGLLTRKTRFGTRQIGDVMGKNWCVGYVRVSLLCERYSAHRLAFLYMEGRWPKSIDHINHIRTDNRWINLREVDQAENTKNIKLSSRNKSGVTGISWDRRCKKWFACLRTGGKTKYLGVFSDKFEAICARKSADNKYGFHSNHGASQ